MRVGLECHEVRWALEKLRLTQALHTLSCTGRSANASEARRPTASLRRDDDRRALSADI